MAASANATQAAEQCVLGALLLDNRARAKLNGLAVEHFEADAHRLIFAAIVDELDDNGAADTVGVFERLARNGTAERAGGLPYLNGLAANAPSAANAPRYAEAVERAARMRAAAAALRDALDLATRGDEAGTAAAIERASKTTQPKAAADIGERLDLRALAATEPRPPQFVVEGWLPAGEATLFAGHGGVGKSLLELMLAVCIALGRPFFGLACKRRRVLVLSYEDGGNVLHWRLHRVCSALGVDLAALDGWLHIFDATKIGAPLFVESRDGAGPTATLDRLRERIADAGAQVLVLDNVADCFAANENDRAKVRAFVQAVRRLVPADGACLLVAHDNKAGARAQGESLGFSGSTAWHNSCRARWYLRPADEADTPRLVLELRKSNHGPAGASIALRYSDAAHCFVPDGNLPSTKLDRGLREVDERAAVLACVLAAEADGDPLPTATSGERTTHKVAEARGLPESLRGKHGRTRFYRHVEALRQAGSVRLGTVKRPNRHLAEVYRTAAPAADAAPATDTNCASDGQFAPAADI